MTSLSSQDSDIDRVLLFIVKYDHNIKKYYNKLIMVSDRTNQQKSRVTVIGAGIGGLTAAALLARKGYKVLVLDQAQNAAQYSGSWNGGLSFDE